VSAIVGHTVPLPTKSVNDAPATKANFETSAVETSCAYGAETSLASLKTLVLLDASVESKPITSTELATLLKRQQQAIKSIGFKIVPYSGLGVTAYYFSDTNTGIYFQGIEGINGTHLFGAAVYSKTLSESKLAALAKLAEKI